MQNGGGQRLFYKLSRSKHTGYGVLDKYALKEQIFRKNGVDYIWYPCGFPYGVPFKEKKTPSCLTILDFSYKLDKKEREYWVDCLKSNDKVVTISDYTRQCLVDEIGQTLKDSIEVIPVPIVSDYGKMVPIKTIRKPFILDINRMAELKNPIALIDAFNIIKDKISEDLVFCYNYSQGKYDEFVIQYVLERKLENRVYFVKAASEGERNWLLKNASILITPSRFEGFGRTPIEAGLCCTPVISTKIPSLYESTLGILNYYENPDNSEELAMKIFSLINEPPSNDELEGIADEYKRAYSPKAVAMKYLRLWGTV